MLLATFTYIYYFSCYMHHELHKSLPNPRLQNFRERCGNVFKSLTNGHWRLKTSVTQADEMSRKKLDMQMRVRKGWPDYLFHGDLRCGPKFPLPRGINKKTVPYLFDVQGQCDPESKTFCCQGNAGWCGFGPRFCDCPSCINYRSFISAELADWIPSNACYVKNFTKRHACELLSNHLSSAVFIGDSLVRHLYSAMLLILTGDPLYGALKTDTPKAKRRICRGDGQFLDSMCQKNTLMRWREIASQQSFCGNKAKFKISFIQAYNTERAHYVFSTVTSLLNQVGAVIFLGIGIHDNFNSTKVIENYLEPTLKIASRSTNGWPRIVWLTAHSAGPLKPLNFNKHQSNAVILSYNRKLTEFCESHGIAVFDTFNMTLGVHSFDGTHFGFGVNILKAQVLLNHLDEEYTKTS